MRHFRKGLEAFVITALAGWLMAACTGSQDEPSKGGKADEMRTMTANPKLGSISEMNASLMSERQDFRGLGQLMAVQESDRIGLLPFSGPTEPTPITGLDSLSH